MKAHEKEHERMMGMLKDAHRARGYETELSLIKDVLMKLVSRVDSVLGGNDGKKVTANYTNVPVSDDDYFGIVSAFKKGMDIAAIAEKFNRHNTTVRSVLIREGVYKVQRRTGGRKSKKRGAKR